MSTVPLPDQPDLEQLKKQAKELRQAARAGESAAVTEIADRLSGREPADLRLSDTQLVIARRHGFASWPRLRRHVDTVTRLTRNPGRLREQDSADPASAFLRLACLSYEGVTDGPADWQRAKELLTARPELTRDSAHAAAAAADVGSLRGLLDQDPELADREGGPYAWTPLVYLAYARHDRDIDRTAVLDSARLLLDAGADPDAGYLWHGLTSPFTVLTGVFGGGEAGIEHSPHHPHCASLARLLLGSGAEANDSQALYNRQFEDANDHLQPLLAYGLGSGDGGPWQRLLGDVLATPAELVRDQLAWAISHGMTERVRLLAPHVDLAQPVQGRRSATTLAATTGHADLVDELVKHGADAPVLSRVQAYVAAALAVDHGTLSEIHATDPGIVDRVRTARPALVVWAAVAGAPGSVRLLVDAGFDVNALGRTDTPGTTEWETALHHAAGTGAAALAIELLELGADPGIRDRRFDGTPLDWAQHFGQPELVELLSRDTAPSAGDL